MLGEGVNADEEPQGFPSVAVANRPLVDSGAVLGSDG